MVTRTTGAPRGSVAIYRGVSDVPKKLSQKQAEEKAIDSAKERWGVGVVGDVRRWANSWEIQLFVPYDAQRPDAEKAAELNPGTLVGQFVKVSYVKGSPISDHTGFVLRETRNPGKLEVDVDGRGPTIVEKDRLTVTTKQSEETEQEEDL